MANTLRFRCYRCIHCCFFVSIDEMPIIIEDELQNLKLKADEYGISLNTTKLCEGFYKLVIYGFCPFYDIQGRRCRIHEVKPLSCRIYPLLINLKTRDIHVSLACDWVIENLDRLTPHDIDVEEVFRYEVENIKILYKKILNYIHH